MGVTRTKIGNIRRLNFRGLKTTHENHENLTPRKLPAIRYHFNTLMPKPLLDPFAETRSGSNCGIALINWTAIPVAACSSIKTVCVRVCRSLTKVIRELEQHYLRKTVYGTNKGAY